MFNDFLLITAKTVSNGIGIFKPLYWLAGEIMRGILFVFDNKYFLSLIVFTILTRVVLFPINLKQQKTMAKTNRIQPKLQKIQKKYNVNAISDPKQRQKANQQQQEEIQALYAREGHNPMNVGCGPMLFQMVFLMGIIGIIYYPIDYILGIKISDGTVAQTIADTIKFDGRYFQLEFIQNIETIMSKYGDKLLANKDVAKVLTDANLAKIYSYKQSLMLGNIDMTKIANFKNWSDTIIIFPIISLVTSLGSSVVSTLIQKKNNPAAGQQQQQMMLMMLMMPLFSFYISFQVPAAVVFYWILSNVIAILQQLVMYWFFPPKRNIAREMIENTIERRSREESIKKVNS